MPGPRSDSLERSGAGCALAGRRQLRSPHWVATELRRALGDEREAPISQPLRQGGAERHHRGVDAGRAESGVGGQGEGRLTEHHRGAVVARVVVGRDRGAVPGSTGGLGADLDLEGRLSRVPWNFGGGP